MAQIAGKFGADFGSGNGTPNNSLDRTRIERSFHQSRRLLAGQFER